MKNNRFELLVVDDDDEFRSLMLQKLVRSGYSAYGAGDGAQALALAAQRHFDVAVLDMNLPGMHGLEVLERFRANYPDCEIIVLTGQGSIETAVKAMQLGALHYLQKPSSLAELEAQIEKAAERRSLRKENEQLRTLLARKEQGHDLVGRSPRMDEIFRLIERAGPSDRAILIQGESGTGKELVAQALHRASGRATRPLVAVNCAALPETLLESELFGHEKGSFTGATAAKQGLFEAADGGTLFIDEIGEMPGSLQAKLLRVLENGALRRVGSVQERKVDVRLLAATNRNLEEEVRAGRFREDLYYRINVMSLELPPLREREGDVPLLIAHFLGERYRIEPDAMQALVAYSWPGNVRQLMNVLERAKILADDDLIRLQDLPRSIVSPGAGNLPLRAAPLPAANISDGDDDLATYQRRKVMEVLQREKNNKAQAARALGISRRKLYRLLEKFRLQDGEQAHIES